MSASQRMRSVGFALAATERVGFEPASDDLAHCSQGPTANRSPTLPQQAPPGGVGIWDQPLISAWPPIKDAMPLDFVKLGQAACKRFSTFRTDE